jgi:hypothetical protein
MQNTLPYTQAVRQLIEQASPFMQKARDFDNVLDEYNRLTRKYNGNRTINPITEIRMGHEERIELEEMMFALKSHVEHLLQEFEQHVFRQKLHKEVDYQQALASYTKKLFDFTEDADEEFHLSDQLKFDTFIASGFIQYLFFSEEDPDLTFLVKKRELRKIKKLAKLLQEELEKKVLLNDIMKQQDITKSLTSIIEVKEPPLFVAKRRHAKLAREFFIKGLAISIYGWHYERMQRYDKLTPSTQFSKKKINIHTAFIDTIMYIVAMIDSDISERRVASVVAKIKPQLQKDYPFINKP